MTLSNQLTEIRSELNAASERVGKMEKQLSPEQWLRSPNGGWSAVQCIEHLNLTSRAFVPLLENAIREASLMPSRINQRYRLDLFGWLLVKSLGSRKSYMRSKTATGFMPRSESSVGAATKEFYELQEKLTRSLAAADRLALGEVRVRSPFNSKVRYNAYSAFRILATHEHRHLTQAENAAGVAS